MVRHNNVVPNQHFKKKWQFNVRTWFNQPARKLRRRKARVAKAKAVFPRPTAGKLRPIVHCPTVRYNMKKRLGRGFTLEELKAAGIPKTVAKSIGIAVDYRRKNRSLESLQENTARLKAYKANLVLFPRKAGKPKTGDASEEELKAVAQLTGPLMPIQTAKPELELVNLSEISGKGSAFKKLRSARVDARLAGKRAKKAAEAAAAEKDA